MDENNENDILKEKRDELERAIEKRKKLEQIVNVRKAKAVDKEIFEKASMILLILGKYRRKDGYEETYWSNDCENEPFEIIIRHSDEIYVEYCNRNVYYGSKNPHITFVDGKFQIYAYIPGQWEEKFECVYNQALRKKEERELLGSIEKENKKIEALEERFGTIECEDS